MEHEQRERPYETEQNVVSLTTGIISVILGTLALITCWIPFLGFIVIPVALVGFLLACIGVVASVATSGKGVGLPFVGALLCATAFCVPFFSSSIFLREVFNAFVVEQPRIDAPQYRKK